MQFILIAALFSVSVSIALKLYRQYGMNIIHLLTVNYITASVQCFLWFKPTFNIAQLEHSWWLIGALAVILPSIFWCLDRALHHAGLIKTEIAQRLSVVLTILVSTLIYHEQFSLLKIFGIVLGVVAVLIMLIGQGSAKSSQSVAAWLSILSVWVGYAVIDLLFKYTSGLGLQFAMSLNAIFICSAILCLFASLFQSQALTLKTLIAGVILGALNFANIAFYLYAHRQLSDSPALVFASMNIMVVCLGILAAVLIFKEQLNQSRAVGGMLAIVAVLILMQSM
ncbi:DMT family transporter [Acinetobacter sp. A3.8]|uniref:DMT family transporter n=1 Tax=Acinetobacter sedimenti TaxID=2919922 RepID=A0A9X1X0Y2_9GAMM|nr:DMT family transporter [Acinetobacter sedimenti]MCJ8145886.1 DMT family transporter [Acinetobacter sedimenti]